MSDKDKPGVFIDLNTGDVSGEPTEKDMEALRKYAESAGIAIGQSKKVANPIKEVVEQSKTAAQNHFKQLDAIFEEMYDFLLIGETRKALEKVREYFQPLQELLNEINDLNLYIEQELEKMKPGTTLYDYLENYTLRDLYDLRSDPNSDFSQLIEAARERESLIAGQQAGRDERQQIKTNAAEQGAIMQLRGGSMPIFSSRGLWDAFAPGRLAKIGTLSADEIDKQTGRIKKHGFSDGEIIDLSAAEISYSTLMLLNAVLSNSVDDYRNQFIEDGEITFYVKGVLDSLDVVDVRTRTDRQLNNGINRKTAGALYLENQFKPLLEYIGTTSDGSRYSVLNYRNYDASSDTMTIRSPYLFMLWKETQQDFTSRKEKKEERIAEGKKPLKKDLTPLEINSLFKGSAYKEDDTILEIATYITNVLLNAGKTSRTRKTEIKFSTIIANCPRLNERLKEIGSRPTSELTPEGKRRNNTAIYNSELRKIARAFKLIMNPDECDALEHFEFISFSPSKEKNGKRELVPPTKSTIGEKIVIEWRRID